jgi:hypothetical protein
MALLHKVNTTLHNERQLSRSGNLPKGPSRPGQGSNAGGEINIIFLA